MSDAIHATVRVSDLGRSALIDDVAPSPRGKLYEFGALLIQSLVGFVGSALGVFTVGVILLIGVIVAFGGATEGMTETLSVLQAGEAPETLEATLVIIAMLAIVNGLFALVFVILASVVRKQSIKLNFTAARRFRWRQLLLGLVLYGTVLGGLLAAEVALGLVEPTWPVLDLTETAGGIALFVAVAIVGFILAAGAEELLFRGWLLRRTAAFTRNIWVLLAINGVLFSLIHLDPDPNAFIARAIMGVAFGYMALRLGGIEFATGAHAANNILLVLFMEPIPLTAPPPEPFTPYYLIEAAVLLVVGIGITEAAVRFKALRTLGGVEEAPRSDLDSVFR